jgi:integrase
VDPKTGNHGDAIGQEFAKLLRKLKLKRPGVSFYALRHTFETIGGDSRDQVAVDGIMGHVDSSMAGHYRERLDDQRLRDVTEHVRRWLTCRAGSVAKLAR